MVERSRASAEPGPRLVEHRPNRDRRQDYQLCLPAGWYAVRRSQEPPDGPTARAAGLFVHDDDLEASIEVRCAKVTTELDPFELLELHLERGGGKVIERAPVDAPTGRVGELVVERPIPSGRAVTLSLIHI